MDKPSINNMYAYMVEINRVYISASIHKNNFPIRDAITWFKISSVKDVELSE